MEDSAFSLSELALANEAELKKLDAVCWLALSAGASAGALQGANPLQMHLGWWVRGLYKDRESCA